MALWGSCWNGLTMVMKEDYEEIVENMSIMLRGNIAHAIDNFEKAKERKEK